MQASIADQAQIATAIPVEDKVFAENLDGLGRLLVQLGRGRNWVPVAAEQLTDWRARANMGQGRVLFLT
jgi:hypothetical protein